MELCEETRVKNCAGSECLTDTLKEGERRKGDHHFTERKWSATRQNRRA